MSLPAPHRLRSPRAPRARGGAVLLGVVLGGGLSLSSGCGVTVPDPISRQAELDADLAGAERGRSPLDDYWSEALGPYLASDALRGYWLTAAEDRFGRYGDRLLEATLREELLSQHAGDLTPEEQERLAELPTYDAAERELTAILSEGRGR